MISEKNSSCLQQLRALALVVSEQNHLTRQAFLRVSQSAPIDLLKICKKLAPQIDWDNSLSQKIKKYNHDLMSAVSIFEDSYPQQLKQIQDPPWILFFKGQNPELFRFRHSIAIVGSRRANYAGLELAEQFAYRLSREGFCVISGMALGIDAFAHKGAIKAGRPLSTIAVLGSGIDVVYPPGHKDLYTDIINSQGSVLSQFEPDAIPYPSNFLNRNRVVSGLASATLVIQATLKSGSLVTAKHSIEQGKDVYVIPGDIDDRHYEGSNRLIQQGAHLITGVEDLFSDLGVQIQKKINIEKSNNISELNILQKQIVQILEEQGTVKVDAMVRQLGNIAFEKELLELEISGQIERLPGNLLKLT